MVAGLYLLTGVRPRKRYKPAFLDALRRYDVVHFAGHSVVNTGRSESSSLVLAPSDLDVGVLSPNEIDGTPTRARCADRARGLRHGRRERLQR